jgi:predicted transcriptional regulator
MTKYTFQLTPELLEALKAVAEAQDRSVSQLIRVALKNYLSGIETAS